MWCVSQLVMEGTYEMKETLRNGLSGHDRYQLTVHRRDSRYLVKCTCGWNFRPWPACTLPDVTAMHVDRRHQATRPHAKLVSLWAFDAVFRFNGGFVFNGFARDWSTSLDSACLPLFATSISARVAAEFEARHVWELSTWLRMRGLGNLAVRGAA
jgi:hypothetical protein